MIYSKVLDNERKGVFLGQTVQVVPHVTDTIKQSIYLASKEVKPDVQIIEIGGTVGDIESLPFLEAIRQVELEVGNDRAIFIHTTLLPYLNTSHELKTKPTQHSIKTLMSLGINPDFVVLRADREISDDIKVKVSKMCTLFESNVIALPDLSNIYEVPLVLYKQKMDKLICNQFKINKKINLKPWLEVIENYKTAKEEIHIAIVGKYIELEDAYISVKEALKHAGLPLQLNVKVDFVNARELTSKNVVSKLRNMDGILVPGGFGISGVEGKIEAIKFAREKKVPFLGICLGLQLATIEYARNVLKMEGANSTEFDMNTPYPIINYLPNQYKGISLGGTMRLGAYDCELKPNTLAIGTYKNKCISERHRHRYEFDNNYKAKFEEAGMIFSGINPQSNLVEIIELPNHPHFIACQFHPEFKSRPTKSHPLFYSLIKAAAKK